MDATPLFLLTVVLLQGQNVFSTREMPPTLGLSGGEPANVTKIIKNIFNVYDKAERPFYRVTPLTIDVMAYIPEISHMSEENMEFKADLYLTQLWQDPRLAFGPKNESVILQRDTWRKLWIPDTMITNAREMTKMADTQTVLIRGSGDVVFSYRTHATLLANLNLRNYPMDTQEFQVGLESYIHTYDKIRLRWLTSFLGVQEIATYTLNSHERKEENISFQGWGTQSHLTLTIKASRRFGYYLSHFYIPCVICAIISWCPFWMDRYSIGDRLTLEITILLTVMFLFQYINSSMPKVSYITAADVYILLSLIFVFLAIMENILVYLYRDDVRKKKVKGAAKEQVLAHSSKEAAKDPHLGQESKRSHEGALAKHRRHSSHVQLEKQRPTARDISMMTDQVSRVAFPLAYLVFIAVYFSYFL